MNYLECRVGNMDIFIPTCEKLEAAIIDTNGKVNYLKRVAKMRKAYYGEVYDDFIVMSPTFIFALEDTLDELGYRDIFHNTLLEFPVKEQYVLFTLLRDGKSFRFLSHNRKIPFEASLTTVQSLFEKISTKII